MQAESFAGYELLQRAPGPPWLERFIAQKTNANGVKLPFRLERLPPNLRSQPAAVRTFADEIATRALIQHPSVVRVLDHGETDAGSYVAYELTDAITWDQLRTTLQSTHHVLPVGVLLEMAIALAEAICQVHAASNSAGQQLMLSHNGISGPHVLLTRDGAIKLDGQRLSGQGLAGRGPGEPGFMAPEVATQEAPDSRSDVFSLGVLLVEMMSSERVAHGQSPVTAPRIESLLNTRSDLPDGFHDLVRQMTAHDPASRPQMVRLIQNQLKHMLQSAPEHPGVLGYVPPGVDHIAPATADNLPAQLMRAVRATGVAYPPAVESEDMAITGVAPTGHDRLTGGWGGTLGEDPNPKPQTGSTPKLTLPKPVAGPTAAAAPTTEPTGTELPKQLFAFADRETSASGAQGRPVSEIKAWNKTQSTGGMPLWLVIGLGVLSVIGAVALTNLIFGGDDPSRAPPKKRRGARNLASVARGNRGLLQITSEPAGATVFVNKKLIRGATPIEVDDLPLNKDVEVSVSKDRFRDPGPRIVRLTAQDKFAALHFSLKALRYFQLITEPPGAMVSVNERKSTQRTPLALTPVTFGETVNVRITRPGYMPHDLELIADTETPTVTRITLVPAKVYEFYSKPEGAAVLIDGERIGKTPMVDVAVKKGRRFELVIHRADARPWKRKLSATGKPFDKITANLRLIPLAKLKLTPEERTELRRIRQKIDVVRRERNVVRRELQMAQRRLRSFEDRGSISLQELEEAQDLVDEVQSRFTLRQADFETAQQEETEFREQILMRLDLEHDGF